MCETQLKENIYVTIQNIDSVIILGNRFLIAVAHNLSDLDFIWILIAICKPNSIKQVNIISITLDAIDLTMNQCQMN